MYVSQLTVSYHLLGNAIRIIVCRSLASRLLAKLYTILTSPREWKQEFQVWLRSRFGDNLFGGEDIDRDGLLAHYVLEHWSAILQHSAIECMRRTYQFQVKGHADQGSVSGSRC